MRSAGKFLAAIARTLELAGPSEAVAALHRGLRRKLPTQQHQLRAEETIRLQALPVAIESSSKLDDETRSLVERVYRKLFVD
jgi:hypothetical protein